MFKTRFTELFGVKYPIMQGAMHWLSRAELAAAVSNAGGLGTLVTAILPTIPELKKELRKMKSLTDKPFCININLFPGLMPKNTDEYIDAILEENPKIIETSGRSPEPYVKKLKSTGAKLIHKVANPRHAITVEKLGYDAVSIVGFECGGHPGIDDLTSLIMVPRTADMVKIPIIAGGGFADGRGLVAALALGADAVVMGTRFMATKECMVHQNVKDWMVKARETDTAVVARSLRENARVMRTDYALKVLDAEAKGASHEQIEAMIDSEHTNNVAVKGDLSGGVLHCGQAVGLVDSIPTAKEVIDSIIAQATQVRKQIDSKITL